MNAYLNELFYLGPFRKPNDAKTNKLRNKKDFNFPAKLGLWVDGLWVQWVYFFIWVLKFVRTEGFYVAIHSKQG